MKNITLVIISFLALSLPAHDALAECVPNPNPAWQSPASGDTDVPTNTVIFVVTPEGISTTVSLNGDVLSPLGQQGYLRHIFRPPADLTANTGHNLLSEITTGGSTTKKLPGSFTTGAGPNTLPPLTLDATAIQTSPRTTNANDPCLGMLETLFCDPETHANWIGVSTTQTPAAWLISVDGTQDSVLLPGTCTPQIFTTAPAQPSTCVTVSSLSEDGTESPPTSLCVGDDLTSTAGDELGGVEEVSKAGGCEPSPTKKTALPLLFCIGLGLYALNRSRSHNKEC